MNPHDPDALTPRQSGQLQAFARYLAAMERGDADALAAILREANDDPTLERLILALHGVYDEVDTTPPTADEVAQAQAMLAAAGDAAIGSADAPAETDVVTSLTAETLDATSAAALNGAHHDTAPSQPLRRWTAGRASRGDMITGDTMSMNTRDLPSETAELETRQSSEPGAIPTHGAPPTTPAPSARGRSRRWLRVAQGLVAAVVVAALVGSFFVVFQRLAPPRGAILVSKVTYEGPFTGKRLVLAGSWTGEVWALDPANGNVYWRFNLGDGNPVTDLLVEGGYVVVGDTYLSAPRVVVVRLSDGKQVWSHKLSGFGVTGPIVADQTAVYLSNNAAAYAFRLSDGEQLWRAPNAAVQATAPGVAFLAVSITQPNTTTSTNSIVAVRVSDGKQLWAYRVSSDPNDPQIVRVVGRTLYLGDFLAPLNSYLALDTKTGNVVKTLPRLPEGSFVLQVTDTQLVTFEGNTPQGGSVCLYQFPSIAQRWCTSERYAPNSYSMVNQYTTTVQDGSVYLQYGIQEGQSGRSYPGVSYTEPPYRPALAAFDITTGHVRTSWVGPLIPAVSPESPRGVSMGGAFDAEQSIAGAQGVVYLGTNSGVFAVNGATGKQRWFFEPTAGDTFLLVMAV